MAEWFYEFHDAPVGPVSQMEILRQLLSGKISPQTLVWQPAFGDRWRTVEEAGLSAISGRFRRVAGFGRKGCGISIMVGSLPSSRTKVQGDQPESSISPASSEEKTRSSVRKRLARLFSCFRGKTAGKPVPMLWGWILLLLPNLLGGIVDFWAGRDHAVPLFTTFLLGLILFFSLTMDRRILQEDGYGPPSFWWWLFLPGYFWVRFQRTGRGILLFAVSILLMLAAIAQFLLQPLPGAPFSGNEAPVAGKPSALTGGQTATPNESAESHKSLEL